MPIDLVFAQLIEPPKEKEWTPGMVANYAKEWKAKKDREALGIWAVSDLWKEHNG